VRLGDTRARRPPVGAGVGEGDDEPRPDHTGAPTVRRRGSLTS